MRSRAISAAVLVPVLLIVLTLGGIVLAAAVALVTVLAAREVFILLRTGGEQRLSNFLIWQSAYAEFYSTEVLWPDFGAEAFDAALLEFARRTRRFGR